MNDFPFYQHFAVKLTFPKDLIIDENFVEKTANLLIEGLKLTVVGQGKHQFPNRGLTKFWILSQSHLIIHSWPELGALHLDLMTCNSTIITAETVKNHLSPLSIDNISISKLEY